MVGEGIIRTFGKGPEREEPDRVQFGIFVTKEPHFYVGFNPSIQSMTYRSELTRCLMHQKAFSITSLS